MKRRLTITIEILLVVTSLSFGMAMITGCGGGGGGQPGIEEFVSGMRVTGHNDLVAVLKKGNPPVESAGPIITAPASATINPGVTVGAVPITSEEQFSTLLLEIPGSSGYFVLDFGSLTGGGSAQQTGTNLAIDITFGANPPEGNFDCLFSGSESGAVGPSDVTAITVEDCTVLDFCQGRCDPVQAIACTQYCDLVDVLPSCILDANAPLVCGAVFTCMDSANCSDAGQCAEEESSGAISSSCAKDTCETIDALGS